MGQSLHPGRSRHLNFRAIQRSGDGGALGSYLDEAVSEHGGHEHRCGLPKTLTVQYHPDACFPCGLEGLYLDVALGQHSVVSLISGCNAASRGTGLLVLLHRMNRHGFLVDYFEYYEEGPCAAED